MRVRSAAARSPAAEGVAHARAVMVSCGASSNQPMKKVERYPESFEPATAMFAAQHPAAAGALGKSRLRHVVLWSEWVLS